MRSGQQDSPAANFRVKQPTREAALRAITEGVAGSAMPSWKTKLNEQQRGMLADYVRSFYAGMND